MTPRFYMKRSIIMVYEVDGGNNTNDTGTRTSTIITLEDQIQPSQIDSIIKQMWREESAKTRNRI